MTTPARQRRPRADARRNYERLLAEAETAFRERGTDAPLEHIARAAGVAIGTLYGHFPHRRALLGAVLRDRHAALFAHADRLVDHPSAWDALADWIRAMVDHAAAYAGLADILAAGVDDEASELHAACQRMTATTAALVDRARKDGAVRPEVTGADVLALTSAAAWLRGRVSREQADRTVDFMLDGLRPDR
ncbi:helix-turn-helix domain-containing protein [Polymorphospora rubra]|uniref:TetR/AcrR family transcriptional regulator n=1 Tax=Polymorphospora rubra TaxID=338584 RepID=UPI00340B50F3